MVRHDSERTARRPIVATSVEKLPAFLTVIHTLEVHAMLSLLTYALFVTVSWGLWKVYRQLFARSWLDNITGPTPPSILQGA